MENVFLHLLNMSLTAGILVVAVLLLRVVLHKAPRWIHVLLWALVAVRLLCPFTIESNLSLMPDTPAVSVPAPAPAPDTPPVENAVPDTPVVDSPTVIPPATEDPSVIPPVVDTPPMTVIPPATDTPVVTPTPESSVVTATPETVVTPWQMVLTVATYVWLAGVALLAAYAVFTTLRLRRQVGEAAHIADNLWQCDHLRSPFILGLFRPRIYLPSDLSAAARDSVVAHEQAHLRRRDHWWKPLGFVLLMVYWFNPLMWVAYVFLCRDIEAACDESVVRNMNAADRRAYSEALLSCSAPRRLVSACPLAFGETAVKSRIKSVLSYKKPTIWIIVAALLVSTVAGVCLLTNRPADKPDTDKPAVSDKDDDPDPDAEPQYAFFTHTEQPYAQVSLEIGGNSCTYASSILSSWIALGTYTMDGDTVTLNFPDDAMTLVFKGDFTGLTFCNADSRYQEEYLTFGGYTLSDGAVFERRDDDPDPAATAPVGLTYVVRSYVSGQEQEAMMGSESVKRFDSRDELEAFLAAHQKTESGGTRWEISDFDQFDTAFFADNALLMTFRQTSSGMFTPQVGGYTYSEDKAVLSVVIDELHPGGMVTMDIGDWILFSGIRKTDLEGVTELASCFGKEIPTSAYAAAFTEPTKYPDKATEKWREFYGYWDEVYLRAMITRLNDGAWVENSSAINRALNFVGCVHINGNLYYVTDQFDGIMSTDGKVGWLTTEESVRVSWLFDEKEHPAYTFIGKVKKVDGNNVLMECLESEWLTGDVWVDFSRFVKSRVGETLKITYDYMELTDPPRVTPIEVAYVSVNPTTGTTKPTTGSTTGTTGTTGTKPTTKPTTTPTTTKAYWQTFSHPMPYEAAVGLTGGVELHQDSVEKLQKLVNTVSWNPWPELWPDAVILSSAFFSLDGETRYFVFGDFLYHENAPSDRCYARITDAQYEMLRDIHRGGVTAQATHTLRGYFAEWNKQAEFYELDVVQADDTSLIGKRVWVRTSYLPGAGIPYIGSLLEVSYDGVVVEWYQKSVYAIDYSVLKADEVTNVTILDSGTVNGKVIYVTDGAALMYFDDLEPYDTVFWVNYKAAYPDLNPQIGEMYRVVYDGLLCTTYPVQAVVQSMTEIDPPAISDKFISEDQAIELAAEYWGIEPGSKDMETAYAAIFYVMVMPTEKVPDYVIGLRYVDALYEGPANSTLFLSIHIDAETGEIWDAPID